jgi:two-component system NtrC family sensor kinase
MMGFHSTVCTSPKEALNCADRQPVTLVFSDFRMPELNGEQFYRQLVARHPELANRVVFLTGDAESPDSQTFFSRTGVPHLDKPCSLELLGQVIRERLPAAA